MTEAHQRQANQDWDKYPQAAKPSGNSRGPRRGPSFAVTQCPRTFSALSRLTPEPLAQNLALLRFPPLSLRDSAPFPASIFGELCDEESHSSFVRRVKDVQCSGPVG